MYEYDIFISYRRSGMVPEWLREHFLPVFEWKLGDSIVEVCGREPKGIFFDDQEIDVGDRISPRIRDALKTSRCLLGLWSPQYFLSRWCVAEAQTFLKRGELTKRPLVAPVSVHDGDSFPRKIGDNDISDIVRGDLRSYVIPGAGFKKTEAYSAFVLAVQALAERLATLVAQAPDFVDWPVVEPEPAKAPAIRLPRLVAQAQA